MTEIIKIVITESSGYCHVDEAFNDKLSITPDSISIVYALALFFITIRLGKLDNQTAEKIYEREIFYLTFQRLREVTNSTIANADVNNLEELKKHIIDFQFFTGRTANMIADKLQGKKLLCK